MEDDEWESARREQEQLVGWAAVLLCALAAVLFGMVTLLRGFGV